LVRLLTSVFFKLTLKAFLAFASIGIGSNYTRQLPEIQRRDLRAASGLKIGRN
jgi:hypothetical protein